MTLGKDDPGRISDVSRGSGVLRADNLSVEFKISESFPSATFVSGLGDSVQRRVDLRRLCLRRELPVFLFSMANLWKSKLEKFEGETDIRMEGLGVNS